LAFVPPQPQCRGAPPWWRRTGEPATPASLRGSSTTEASPASPQPQPPRRGARTEGCTSERARAYGVLNPGGGTIKRATPVSTRDWGDSEGVCFPPLTSGQERIFRGRRQACILPSLHTEKENYHCFLFFFTDPKQFTEVVFLFYNQASFHLNSKMLIG
jgi:hypothetical protein